MDSGLDRYPIVSSIDVHLGFDEIVASSRRIRHFDAASTFLGESELIWSAEAAGAQGVALALAFSLAGKQVSPATTQRLGSSSFTPLPSVIRVSDSLYHGVLKLEVASVSISSGFARLWFTVTNMSNRRSTFLVGNGIVR